MAFSVMTQDQQAVFMKNLTTAQVQLQVMKDAAINTQVDADYDAAVTALNTAVTAMTTVVDASIGG